MENELPKESLINQSFASWAYKRVLNIKGFAFILISATSVIYSFVVSAKLIDYPITWHFPILYIIQTIMIFIILIVIAFAKSPKCYKNEYPRGSDVLQQFWNWWSWLWATWLILYIVFTIKDLTNLINLAYATGKTLDMNLTKFVMHQFNNLSTLIFLMLYHILSEPSVPEKGKVEGDIFPNEQINLEEQQNLSSNSAKFIFWITLFVILAICEFFLLNIPSQANEIVQIFGIASGVLAAIGIALVVGKLDSNLLGVPTWAITFLLLYVGIQPSLDFILNSEGNYLIKITQEVIMIIALISKILFFALIQWLISTNRMLYYFVQGYTLQKGVSLNRNDFLKKTTNN